MKKSTRKTANLHNIIVIILNDIYAIIITPLNHGVCYIYFIIGL